MKYSIAFVLLLVVATSYADDAPKPTPSKTTFYIAQIPGEDWNGKEFSFYAVLKYPDMTGLAIEDAQHLKKSYVTQGLKKAIQFLVRLVTFKVDDFSMGEQAVHEYQHYLNFGKAAIEHHYDIGQAQIDPLTQEDHRFLNMDLFSQISVLKDNGTGKYESIFYPVFSKNEINNLSTADKNFYIDNGPTGVFHPPIGVSNLPNIGYGKIDSGKIADLTFFLTNQKLFTIFQTTGPVISAAEMATFETEIQRKLKPYSLNLLDRSRSGGTSMVREAYEASSDDQSEDEPKQKMLSKPAWLRKVDVDQGKIIWAYLMLSQAKIEPERDGKDPNVIEIKVSVDMEKLGKIAKAEKYENYIVK